MEDLSALYEQGLACGRAKTNDDTKINPAVTTQDCVKALLHIPQSYEWKLICVPSDAITPLESTWRSVLQLPGVYDTGLTFGVHRLAVDQAYLPWLECAHLHFKLDTFPLKPSTAEMDVYGAIRATERTEARYFKQAFEAISTGLPGLDTCFLQSASQRIREPLMRAIWTSKLETNPTMLAHFANHLQQLAWTYFPEVAKKLLGKDDELLRDLRTLLAELSMLLSKMFITTAGTSVVDSGVGLELVRYWINHVFRYNGVGMSSHYVDFTKPSASKKNPYWLAVARQLLRSHLEQPKGDSLACPQTIGIPDDQESGRLRLEGYDFNSCTLVRVSGLGPYAQNLSKIGNADRVLSMVKLEDESWELLVLRSNLPMLEDMLLQDVPHCVIDLDYNPLEPNAREVEEFGIEKAKGLRTLRLRKRAECIMPLPEAAAYYCHVIMGSDNGL